MHRHIQVKQSGGVNSSGGNIFCACPDQPEAHPVSCTVVTKSFLVVKWLGHDTDHPLPSSTKVANGLEIYLCLPSVHHWRTKAVSIQNIVFLLNIGDKGISPCECWWYHSCETTVKNLHVTSQSTEVPNRYFQDKQFRKFTIQHWSQYPLFSLVSLKKKKVSNTTAKVKNW